VIKERKKGDIYKKNKKKLEKTEAEKGQIAREVT
jgi:hypothetical protein